MPQTLRHNDVDICYHYEEGAIIALLKSCAKQNNLEKGSRIHADIIDRGLFEKNCCIASTVVSMYAKCGALGKARQVLQELPKRSIVAWNALISGYVQHGKGEEALHCVTEMHCEGLSPNAVTFATLLKACANMGALKQGEQIHEDIVEQRLLEKSVILGTALVDMYVKCGALEKARQVLHELPVQDVVTWNALIAGYSHQGRGKEALHCIDRMQIEGLSPSAVTFACALRACGSIRALDRGERICEEIIKQQLLENNAILGTALVDMYAKCGALGKAYRVLQSLPIRDVASWNALITGYIHQGKGKEVLSCIDRMQQDGLSPDAVTFACALQACGNTGAVDRGEEIHEEIVKQRLLEKDVVLGNALVDMYSKCGALEKAQEVLHKLPVRDVYSWNALIAGYTQHGKGEEALSCIDRMQREGISADAVSFSCALRACGSIRAADQGETFHKEIVKEQLLETNVILGNSLVDMYAKCGNLEKAVQVLHELPIRDVVSWNTLITAYVQQGKYDEALSSIDQMLCEGFSPNVITFASALQACGNMGAVDKGVCIHEEIVKQQLLENNVILGTALVDMYAKCGALEKAQGVLQELPVQDATTWNALIAGYVQQGKGEKALSCIDRMQSEGLSLDAVTFACTVRACGSIGATNRIEQIHKHIVSQRLLADNGILGNVLVDIYAKCGAFEQARQVLYELPNRDIVSWNALITGYVQHGKGEEALSCLDQIQQDGLSPDDVTFTSALRACASIEAADRGERIHEEIVKQGLLANNVVLSTALVDMYAKCDLLGKAQQVLYELPFHDIVSWTALIAGYVQQGKGEEALSCFDVMQHKGFLPDTVTYVCVLGACGLIGALDKGEQIYEKITKQCLLETDVVLGNALVDMYAKCGALERARKILHELPVRNAIAWTALIMGFMQQGKSEEVMMCFNQMEHDGHPPNSVTLLCVINTCNHSGLLAEGQIYFENMRTRYGETPSIDHYCCMIDLFGRSGDFNKALAVIGCMPSYTCLHLWHSLLGACWKWKNVEVGRLAFEHAVHIDQHEAATYVVMFNIYLAVGMHEAAVKFEDMRKRNRVWTMPGCSQHTDASEC